jgi:acyl-CoA synthetase (AMP-forming)/AMP-acid ligase II
VSILTMLEMAAAVTPDRVAIGGPAGLTYAGLRDRVAATAAAVAASGARSVVFVGTSGDAWPITLFAAAAARVPVVPLNYRLAAEQLTALVERVDAPLVVADARYRPVFARSVDAAEFTAAADPGPLPAEDPDPDATAVILFTSGTTSAPKGVVLRHANLQSYVFQTVEFGAAEEDECALVSVPPYHVAGVGTVLTNCYATRRLRYLPDFDPADWLRIVRAEGVTQAMLVPTMLARIVDRLDADPAELPTLRSIAYGGAPMPPRVLERALALLPGVDFVNSYGLTETSSTIAVLGPEDHRTAIGSTEESVRRRLGSVGRPVPGVEVRVVDPTGAELGAGQPGELWVRGPQVSGEYLGQGPALGPDGWFPTRDRAELDEHGFLYVRGRLDDTIIRGGENIAPAEIESVLAGHPLVRDVGVLGVPDDEWGQRTVAVVVLDAAADGVSAAELRDWVRARVRGSRTPDEIVFRAALPYNALGKLVRRELLG